MVDFVGRLMVGNSVTASLTLRVASTPTGNGELVNVQSVAAHQQGLSKHKTEEVKPSRG